MSVLDTFWKFPNTKLISYGLGLLGYLMASPLTAGPSMGALTLESALSKAYENNPEFSAARQEADVSLGLRQQAGLIPNPELSWDVEDTRSNKQISSITLTQPIELGGKRQARVDVANASQVLASADIDYRTNSLRADVMQAFYAALKAQEGLQLAKQAVELADNGLTIAKGRVEAGKTSPVELSRAEVQLSTVRVEVRRAQLERDSTYKQLAALLGESVPVFSQVQGSFEHLPGLPTRDELLGRIRGTPELRRALLQIDRSEAELHLERTQRIPDIRVSIGSQYDEQERERVNLVGISLPLPLFDRNQGNIYAASRRADQARDLRNAAELRLRSETLQAYEQWEIAVADISEFRQSILPAGRQAVESATRGFAMGKFSFLDVLDAQRTLISSRGQYLQSLESATDALVRLERIYGDAVSFYPSQITHSISR